MPEIESYEDSAGTLESSDLQDTPEDDDMIIVEEMALIRF